MAKDIEGQLQAETDRLFCRGRILYIDDDAGLGRLLQRRLARMAYEVTVAQDGKQGLAVFSADAYDVVITDYNMPEMNGLEVLQQLKDTVPVIFLTGQGDERVAVEAMKLGAADYLSKDIGSEYIELLPSIIDRVMERQQLIRDRQQAQEQLAASEARYRAIVEDQTELICRFEPEGKLTFANAAFCRFFGIRPTDIAFLTMATVLSRKPYQALKESLAPLTSQSPVTTSTLSSKTTDGKNYWLQWTGRAIFGNNNALVEYQIVGHDITEIKLIEEALKESEAKLAALLSGLPDTVLLVDRKGALLRVKHGGGPRLPSAVVGKNLAEVFPPAVVTELEGGIGKTVDGGACEPFQFRIRQSDGLDCYEARLVTAGKEQVLIIMRGINQ